MSEAKAAQIESEASVFADLLRIAKASGRERRLVEYAEPIAKRGITRLLDAANQMRAKASPDASEQKVAAE